MSVNRGALGDSVRIKSGLELGRDWSTRAAARYRLETLLSVIGEVRAMLPVALPDCDEREKAASALGEAQLWAGKAFERGFAG